MQRRAVLLAVVIPGVLILLAACQPGSEAPPAADSAGEEVAHDDAATDEVAGDADPAEEAGDAGPPPPAEELRLPPGMAGVRWAEGLQQPVGIAFDAEGGLLVAESGGRVWRFEDGNGDHRADPPQLFAEGLGELRGIATAADGSVLLSQRGQVSRLTDSDGDGVADVVTPIVRGLPDRVRANNAIAEGPDGLIYVSIGSTCND